MAGPMTGKDNNRIVAMTYNVCFSLMANIANYNNIKKVFNNVATEFGPLDLVGIQEPANNWWHLINETPALNSLSFVHSREARAHLISLYNPKKFNLDAFIPSDIRLKGKNTPQGRPSHILFLTHISSGKKYIFINIHNGHGDDYKHLEEELSKKIVKNLDPTHSVIISIPGYNNYHGEKNDPKDPKPVIPYDPNLPLNRHQINYIPTMQKTDYSSIISSNTYDIIFMGDTNFSSVNIWHKSLKFTPLRHMNINVDVSSNNIPPPQTCCSDLRIKIGDDTQIGDYILISDKLKYEITNVIPRSFNPDSRIFPTSDHLPVVSVIRLPSSTGPSVSHPSSSKTSIFSAGPSVSHPSSSKTSIFSAGPSVSHPSSSKTSIFSAGPSVSHPVSHSISKKNIDEPEFIIETQKTLRMQNSIDDPNKNIILNSFPFQGKIVKPGMTLVYPNGKANNVPPNGAKPAAELVFVQSLDNPNKIGYVNFDYIENIKNIRKNEWKLKKLYPTRKLRLQVDPRDPGDSKIAESLFPFAGMTIDNTETLIFPNGETTTNGLVIVQVEDNPNIIGYIQSHYLKEKNLLRGGGTRKNKKNNRKNHRQNHTKSRTNKNSKKSKKIINRKTKNNK